MSAKSGRMPALATRFLSFINYMLKSNVIVATAVGLVLGILAELFFAFLDRVPVLGCLATPVALVFGLALPFFIGAMAAAWGTRTGLLAAPSAAVDGAAAAALAELVSRLVGFCASLTLARSFFFGPLFLLPSVGPAARALFSGIWSIGWLIVSLAVAALLGALGGFLYRSSRPAA